MKLISALKNSAAVCFSAALLMAVSFTGCKKSEVPPGDAYIQIVNASELSAAQDFYIEGAKLTQTPIAYGQSTPGYLTVKAKEQQAQFKIASNSLVSASFAVGPETGNYYSIYYLGEEVAAYQDDPTPAQTGKAKVRFINLSSAIKNDVDFAIAGSTTRLSTGLIQYLATDYYNVDPGTQFVVYERNSTNVLLNIAAPLEAGKTYTLYATGSAGAITYKVVTKS